MFIGYHLLSFLLMVIAAHIRRSEYSDMKRSIVIWSLIAFTASKGGLTYCVYGPSKPIYFIEKAFVATLMSPIWVVLEKCFLCSGQFLIIDIKSDSGCLSIIVCNGIQWYPISNTSLRLKDKFITGVTDAGVFQNLITHWSGEYNVNLICLQKYVH